MPSIVENRLSGKKYRKHLLRSFQNTNLTQTKRSVFAKRIEEKANYKLDKLKTVEIFLVLYGSYGSNLLTFENLILKSLPFLATHSHQQSHKNKGRIR